MLDSVWVKVPYLVLTLALVVMHMEYVHRRRSPYTRRFIVFQLGTDLVGFSSTYLMLTHFRPGERWIPWFLGVHFVVHVASLAWALLHWKSLQEHMVAFQARRLHPVVQASEFLYEQSDTALYLSAVAIVGATLPTWAMAIGIMLCSTIFAAWRPTAGFATAPAGPEAVTLPKAA
jgi:hypothetical protein